jgi:hypothetical protein
LLGSHKNTSFLNVSVDAMACGGNYRWDLLITYRVVGERHLRTARSKTVVVYGLAERTTFFQGYQVRDGSIRGRELIRSGSDPECAGIPGVKAFAPLEPLWPEPTPWPASSPSSEPTPTTSAMTPTPTPSSSPSPTPTQTSTSEPPPTP